MSLRLFLSLSLVFAFGILAGKAFGQDRSDFLLERNVKADAVAVDISLADGGCTITARGEGAYDGGLRMNIVSDAYPFNGARCTTLRTAALCAVKRELGVGSCAAP